MNCDKINSNLKHQIEDILKKVAQCENVANYKICTNIDNDKGNGYLGEFFKGSFRDLDSQKEYFVAIKKSLPESSYIRSVLDLPVVYKVENHFYSKVFPALNALQKSHKVQNEFNSVPHYYFGSLEPFHETVVMKDILPEGFELHPKHLPLPSKNIKLIFKTYGKFHALSMAFKEQKLEEYKNLTSILPKYFSMLVEAKGFRETNNKAFNRAINLLDPVEHIHILEKLTPYREDVTSTLYTDSINYIGDYSTFVHGDCWSNNMLHKYNENGEPIDMKLLDFQLSGVGTPVYDLSYFFYAGAGKDDLIKLDDYLDIYYESFTKFAKELGSDPNKLFPKNQLKQDWKKYAKVGFFMAVNIIGAKTVSKEQVSEIVSTDNDKGDIEVFTDNSEVGQKYFAENVIPLLQHVYEYGVI